MVWSQLQHSPELMMSQKSCTCTLLGAHICTGKRATSKEKNRQMEAKMQSRHLPGTITITHKQCSSNHVPSHWACITSVPCLIWWLLWNDQTRGSTHPVWLALWGQNTAKICYILWWNCKWQAQSANISILGHETTAEQPDNNTDHKTGHEGANDTDHQPGNEGSNGEEIADVMGPEAGGPDDEEHSIPNQNSELPANASPREALHMVTANARPRRHRIG